MREIGSEFWDVPTQKEDNLLFPKYARWFLSGRSALQAIIKDLKDCHTVAVPSWCCDSMIKPFVDAGLEVCFYPVYYDAGLVQQIDLHCDVLFLMDYFGYRVLQPDLTGYNGVVIRDITHSLFSYTHFDADYFFGSLRKWCGIYTGGYLWTRDGYGIPSESNDDNGYISLRERAMLLKRNYINNPDIIDKSYLGIYNQAEEILENIGIVRADERDIVLAQKLDMEYIKSRRRTNAELLRNAFSEWLIFPEMSNSDCPMFVPVIVPDGKRDELRGYLIQHDIYCPVHWPESEYHDLDERTRNLYINELSLVCDQRYTEKDMKRMIDTINAFWKEV